MKHLFTTVLATSILAITLSAHGAVNSHSGSVILERPSDLSESAHNAATAMYLHETRAGEENLYLEQRDRRRLAVLDVTDPARIRTVSQVTLDARAPYDCGRDPGDSAALSGYRDNSGVSVLNFKKYKQPVLISAPAVANARTYEPLGNSGLLLESTGTLQQPESGTTGYSIVELSPQLIRRYLQTSLMSGSVCSCRHRYFVLAQRSGPDRRPAATGGTWASS